MFTTQFTSQFVKTASVAVIAALACLAAQAADIRTAEPMVITAKRIAPAALQVRVAQPMVVVAKREVSNVQVAAKAAARRAA
jgi:hypothetical protein